MTTMSLHAWKRQRHKPNPNEGGTRPLSPYFIEFIDERFIISMGFINPEVFYLEIKERENIEIIKVNILTFFVVAHFIIISTTLHKL